MMVSYRISKIGYRTGCGLACVFALSNTCLANTINGISLEASFAEGAVAQLEVEDCAGSALTLRGRVAADDGEVLISSFILVLEYEYLAGISDDLVTVNKQNEIHVLDKKSFELGSFRVAEGDDYFAIASMGGMPSAPVVSGEGLNYTQAQIAYEKKGGAGNILVTIAHAVNQLHPDAGIAVARGQGCSSPTWTQCMEFAACNCGAAINEECCESNPSSIPCCIDEFTYNPSTCACGFTCKKNCEPGQIDP